MKIKSYLEKFQFSIRFKFMVALLLIVTFALGTITYTMARLFHQDKTAYIYDLTSVVLLHTSQEANFIIKSYQDKLSVFSQILGDNSIASAQKSGVLKSLFGEYREFLAISVYESGVERYSIYDAKGLDAASISEGHLVELQRSVRLSQSAIKKGELEIDGVTTPSGIRLMVVAMSTQIDGIPIVISALVRLDSLQNLANRSAVFETFILDKNGVSLVQKQTQGNIPPRIPQMPPTVSGDEGVQSQVTTREYRYNDIDMVGGFSRLDLGDVRAIVQIPKAAAYLTAREILVWLLGVALLLLLASALFSILWTQRLTRPIERLSQAVATVGAGDFDVYLKSESRDEIGNLSNAFNHMVDELKARETALKEAHAKLIQSEKMSAFGQIGAGIAHEIKNPLAGILGMAQLSLRKTQQDTQLHSNLKTIEKETKRCRNIIDNLMKFARTGKTEFFKISVNSVIEDAVTIVSHQLGINQITLEIELADGLPSVYGNSNQLQQVLLNLVINSQQAMSGKNGLIRIASKMAPNDFIEISVEDNGPGISKEIQSKIFDPFFTTKPIGEGTGLGLSVSYGIVKDHNGNLAVKSAPGKGCVFIVTLPIAQEINMNTGGDRTHFLA